MCPSQTNTVNPFELSFKVFLVHSLIADAEVMYVVSEIISELPGLQDNQFAVWMNHTSLLSSILTYCSIPVERHTESIALLYKMVVSPWGEAHVTDSVQSHQISFFHRVGL